MRDTTMTEHQIELWVQTKFDALDRRLMAHDICQHEYNQEARRIDAWANRQYLVAEREEIAA